MTPRSWVTTPGVATAPVNRSEEEEPPGFKRRRKTIKTGTISRIDQELKRWSGESVLNTAECLHRLTRRIWTPVSTFRPGNKSFAQHVRLDARIRQAISVVVVVSCQQAIQASRASKLGVCKPASSRSIFFPHFSVTHAPGVTSGLKIHTCFDS